MMDNIDKQLPIETPDAKIYRLHSENANEVILEMKLRSKADTFVGLFGALFGSFFIILPVVFVQRMLEKTEGYEIDQIIAAITSFPNWGMAIIMSILFTAVGCILVYNSLFIAFGKFRLRMDNASISIKKGIIIPIREMVFANDPEVTQVFIEKRYPKNSKDHMSYCVWLMDCSKKFEINSYEDFNKALKVQGYLECLTNLGNASEGGQKDPYSIFRM